MGHRFVQPTRPFHYQTDIDAFTIVGYFYKFKGTRNAQSRDT
jgi:hypothetical protein